MSPEATTQPGGGRVYSARHAKWLLRPWRRLLQRPKRILGDLAREGATVADIGCGPGYFTLPLARMVGPTGQVVALDLQPEMLERVRQRAERAGLLDRIRFHQCRPDAIDCPAPVDGILACYIVHEVPDVSPLHGGSLRSAPGRRPAAAHGTEFARDSAKLRQNAGNRPGGRI